MSIAAIPTGDVEVPRAVAALGFPRLRPVWRNQLGGLTFAVDDEVGRPELFVKWARHPELDLAAEAERLTWLDGRVPAPEVVDHGVSADGEWLVTRACGGASAVSPEWLGEPRIAVRAVGEGLRALHERLDATDCPFDWSVEHRLNLAVSRGRDVDAVPAAPPLDRLVVCHGDACAPNTLIGADGRYSAHVDFGALGTADRWADIAVATWSTEWNYGPGWEKELLDAYGVEPDEERSRFYRALWDAT